MQDVQIDAESNFIRVKAVAVALALIVALAMAPLPGVAYAATTAGTSTALTTQEQQAQTAGKTLTTQAKKKSVKQSGFLTQTQAIEKKATYVKKGTTKVTVKKGQGYLAFTAPSSKKYSFTFSNLKASNSYSSFAEVQKRSARNPQYVDFAKVKTKGGTTETLWMSLNGYAGSSYSKPVNRPIPTRTGSLKLNKGEKVYFYFYNGGKKTTFNLKVK